MLKDREAVWLASHEEISKLLTEIKDTFDAEFVGINGWAEAIDIDYLNEIIEITTYYSSGCGCCAGDTEHTDIPMSYLWNNKWVDDYKQRLEEERKFQEDVAANRKKQEEKKTKERRYQQYLDLKKEFEGV